LCTKFEKSKSKKFSIFIFIFRWKQLISGYSTKKTSLVTLRERFLDLEEKCEVLELLLAQVADILGSINPSDTCSIGELQANSAQVTVINLLLSFLI
jgi:hypothetical protein